MEKTIKMSENQLTLIKQLIDMFTKNGWNFDGKIPHIHSSELIKESIRKDDGSVDIEKIRQGKEDLLGEYIQEGGSWENEGRIVLYRRVIEAVAKEFVEYDRYIHIDDEKIDKTGLLHFITADTKPDYGVNIDEAIEYLNTIVLLHEAAHWAIHWLRDSEGNYLTNISYFEDKEILFHESLAQYFTLKTLETHNNDKMLDLFNWLTSLQSKVYKIFRDNYEWDYKEKRQVRVIAVYDYEVEKVVNIAKYCRLLNQYYSELMGLLELEDNHKENIEAALHLYRINVTKKNLFREIHICSAFNGSVTDKINKNLNPDLINHCENEENEKLLEITHKTIIEEYDHIWPYLTEDQKSKNKVRRASRKLGI